MNLRPSLHQPVEAPKLGSLSGSSLASVWAGLVLISAALWCPACGPAASSPPTPDSPAVDAAAAPPVRQLGARQSAGELHLRVPAGTVVRSGPEPSATATAWLKEGGVFRVVGQVRGAYRIEFPASSGAGDETQEGWVRSAAGSFQEIRMTRTRLGPQMAPEPDPEVLAVAAEHLGSAGHELPCGPYRLLTDVRASEVIDLCARIAAGLDDAYVERFGVRPVGEPRGAIILFRRLEAFRRFAAAPGGHAGHALASRGYLALYLGDRPPRELATTLAHELTHLVNRRALGGPLPRWLSEGLADAIGDPATVDGLAPSVGLKGSETARRRVLERSDLPDLRTLTALGPGEFDADASSRDYEQGAVLVRFLLSDPERRRGFQSFLRGVASGKPADFDTLLRLLGPRLEAAEELEAALRRWLESGDRVRPSGPPVSPGAT
ncbi:MAG: hypothetical protein AAGM22_23775 [Acidobacteriota bacterium]